MYPSKRRPAWRQARRAAALLRTAEKAVPALPASAQLLVAVLIDLHHELLAELRAREYNNVDGPRIRVSTSRKLVVSLRTALTRLVARP